MMIFMFPQCFPVGMQVKDENIKVEFHMRKTSTMKDLICQSHKTKHTVLGWILRPADSVFERGLFRLIPATSINLFGCNQVYALCSFRTQLKEKEPLQKL